MLSIVTIHHSIDTDTGSENCSVYSNRIAFIQRQIETKKRWFTNPCVLGRDLHLLLFSSLLPSLAPTLEQPSSTKSSSKTPWRAPSNSLIGFWKSSWIILRCWRRIGTSGLSRREGEGGIEREMGTGDLCEVWGRQYADSSVTALFQALERWWIRHWCFIGVDWPDMIHRWQGYFVLQP